AFAWTRGMGTPLPSSAGGRHYSASPGRVRTRRPTPCTRVRHRSATSPLTRGSGPAEQACSLAATSTDADRTTADVVQQRGDRFLRARLVRTDSARRASLDPAHDVRARAALHPARHVRDRAGVLVERQAT